MERPIIFSGPMVRAILEGRKTQTRRVVRPEWKPTIDREYLYASKERSWSVCPYGQPGDLLWVRETWAIFTKSWTDYGWEGDGLVDIPIPQKRPMDGMCIQYFVVYSADGYEALKEAGERWRPSIHMPRWASRLTLRITEVRVHRLQEITEEDAKAEGVDYWVHGHGPVTSFEINVEPGYWGAGDYRTGFWNVWDDLNEKRAPWDSNPWVWAISFQREAIA